MKHPKYRLDIKKKKKSHKNLLISKNVFTRSNLMIKKYHHLYQYFSLQISYQHPIVIALYTISNSDG